MFLKLGARDGGRQGSTTEIFQEFPGCIPVPGLVNKFRRDSVIRESFKSLMSILVGCTCLMEGNCGWSSGSGRVELVLDGFEGLFRGFKLESSSLFRNKIMGSQQS